MQTMLMGNKKESQYYRKGGGCHGDLQREGMSCSRWIKSSPPSSTPEGKGQRRQRLVVPGKGLKR